jgi:hypothetical protein
VWAKGKELTERLTVLRWKRVVYLFDNKLNKGGFCSLKNKRECLCYLRRPQERLAQFALNDFAIETMFTNILWTIF